MLKLSIITVNLNNAIGLEKTVLSVLNQNFLDYEYLVVDGGSTDGSINVIRKHEDRLVYWVSEKDSGIYQAMNKGIRKASGEYCLFLNSGDKLAGSDTLKRVFSVNRDEDIIYGDIVNVENGAVVDRKIYPDKITFKHFYYDTLGHQATFIKRALFDDVGYYSEDYTFASDWEFFLKALFKKEHSYLHINECVCLFDTTGISNHRANYEEMQRERTEIMMKLFPLFFEDYLELDKVRKKLKAVQNNPILFWIKKKVFPIYKTLVLYKYN